MNANGLTGAADDESSWMVASEGCPHWVEHLLILSVSSLFSIQSFTNRNSLIEILHKLN